MMSEFLESIRKFWIAVIIKINSITNKNSRQFELKALKKIQNTDKITKNPP